MSFIVQLYEARWLLLSIALLTWAANQYQKYARLKNFKGPFSTGWSEIWHVRQILNKRSHLAYKEVNNKYGPIARVGPNDLVTSSPDLLAHMNTVRSSYTRTPWFNGATRVEPGKDHVFSQLDEPKHVKRRQQMAAGYSGKENLSLELDIDGRVKELLGLIRTKYLSTSQHLVPMDLALKLQFFTMDVISKIGFGEAFGDLKTDADVNEYIVSSEQGLGFVTIFGALGIAPYLQWPPLARLIGPSETDYSGFGKMISTARTIIESRLEKSTKGRSDMLASFIRHGLTKEDLVSEALLQIAAGSDTTATGLRSTMLYIITHAPVYNRLRAEIDAAVASDSTLIEGGIVQDTTLRSLPYLQAVVREGLRIHPPVTDIIPKVVPKGGDTIIIDGEKYFLPEGTNIGYDAWGLHHSKVIFGEDADYFRPERWLIEENGKNQDQLDAMRRTTEMIFGYGKFQCLGKPIAWLEISKVIFELLRHFDIALSKPEKPWTSANYIGIFVQKELWVTVTERGRTL